jgi:4-hydroxy-3-polyprenylbenzoate decarboxylase
MASLRVVVGVTGASGAALGLRVVEMLRRIASCEIHLVVSDAAGRTLEHEVGGEGHAKLLGLAHHCHGFADIGATIASGSFRTAGMIVAPCSMRTLAAIASGITDNLVARAADVHLKERRRVVLLARETPLHLGHIRNMAAVTEMGAVVMPPVPAFYRRPESIDDLIDHIAARAVDQLRLSERPLADEWSGQNGQSLPRT